MRCLLLAGALLLTAPAACSKSSSDDPAAGGQQPGTTRPGDNSSDNETMNTRITLTIGGRQFPATLRDHAAARAFVQQLPLTLRLHELNGNEKYGDLPAALPTEPVRPGTIHAGDLMLYGSDCLVLFYETFSSSYSYTPLGTLDTTEGLQSALGAGDVQVTFAAAE